MLQMLFLAALLLVCSLGPGLFFVRWLRWNPAETLSAAIGLSLVLVYASSFVIYAVGLPKYSYFFVTVACLVLSALSAVELRRLLKSHVVCRQLKAFAFLFIWGLLLMSFVRHFSGGTWAGDWWEHYERTVFFLEHWPRDYRFIKLYPLPARPPLMNLVAAHYLAQVGATYPHFQIVFLFLNLLVIMPLCMMLSVFARRGGRSVLVLVALLAGNPMLWQNATFTWTKLLTAFYIVLGVWFYLRGFRKGDRVRMGAGFFSVSAGFLVHFSAGPYGLFLGLHYLFVVFPWRAAKWREALALVLPSLCLLASWFGWSIAVYGRATTFGSNTAVSQIEPSPGSSTLSKVGANVFYSTVPHPFHLPLSEFNVAFSQPSSAGWWRDYLFPVYQTNMIFSMGLAGGPLVVYLLYRTLFRSDTPVLPLKSRSKPGPSDRWFWLSFVVFCSLVGIAVHPTSDHWGVAHICNQPLTLLGVTFLAARYLTLPPLCRGLLVTGLALDFLLGIALHFGLESRVFPYKLLDNQVQFSDPTQLVSLHGFSNYASRVSRGIVYWGDYLADVRLLLWIPLILGFIVVLGLLIQFDRRHAHLCQSSV